MNRRNFNKSLFFIPFFSYPIQDYLLSSYDKRICDLFIVGYQTKIQQDFGFYDYKLLNSIDIRFKIINKFDHLDRYFCEWYSVLSYNDKKYDVLVDCDMRIFNKLSNVPLYKSGKIYQQYIYKELSKPCRLEDV